MGRRTGLGRAARAVVVAGVLMLALGACNPLVNQPTHSHDDWGPGSGTWSHSWKMDYDGTGSGWLEVQVIEAIDPTVSVAGRYLYLDGHACGGELPSTATWADGASLGWVRLAWVDPSAHFQLWVPDSGEPIRFNVRVVDDAGAPVGDIEPRVPSPGQFEDVGWPIC